MFTMMYIIFLVLSYLFVGVLNVILAVLCMMGGVLIANLYILFFDGGWQEFFRVALIATIIPAILLFGWVELSTKGLREKSDDWKNGDLLTFFLRFVILYGVIAMSFCLWQFIAPDTRVLSNLKYFLMEVIPVFCIVLFSTHHYLRRMWEMQIC